MRKVKRWRYYCDFCKKAGGSGRHIARHEKWCTMNPDRICGVCGMLEVNQKPISELLAVIPNSKDYEIESEYGDRIFIGKLPVDVEKAMPALRELTENCPACIMAALRQAKIPVPMVESFNFTEEMKSICKDINADNHRKMYYG